MAFPAFHNWCSINPEPCIQKLLTEIPIMFMVGVSLLIIAYYIDQKEIRKLKGGENNGRRRN